MTPCNTPATPPNFPDTLLAFSKLSAGSPSQGPNMMQSSAPPIQTTHQPQAAQPQR